MENDLISGLPHLSHPAPPEASDGSCSDTPDDNTAASAKDARIPHLRLYKKKFKFEDSGEPGEADAQGVTLNSGGVPTGVGRKLAEGSRQISPASLDSGLSQRQRQVCQL